MILADTSIWIHHLRDGDEAFAILLSDRRIVTHAYVIGEVALGSIRNRRAIIGAMWDLPRAVQATDDEVMSLIGRHALHGTGIGWVDAHLIAAVLLTPGARLMTLDRRLRDVATRLSIAEAGSR